MSVEFVTVKEFAVMVRMHPNSIYKGIRCGRINAFRIGQGSKSSYRIPTSEIHRLAERNMKEVMDSIFSIHTKNVGLI
jgi:hypothetical protein